MATRLKKQPAASAGNSGAAGAAQPAPPPNPTNVFQLQWNFGFNRDVVGGVLNLSDGQRSRIAYAAGHTGILYDYVKKEQKLLSGHVNTITTMAVSPDKRWLVTADCGDYDSTIIVWDTHHHGLPVKTIFQPHGGKGVHSLDMSRDCKYIATMGSSSTNNVQELAIWDWTRPAANPGEDKPLVTCQVEASDRQTCLKFNPEDSSELVCNGVSSVHFLVWDKDTLEAKAFAPEMNSKDFQQGPRIFTTSSFLPQAPSQVVAPTGVHEEKSSEGAALSVDAIEAINHLPSHACTGTSEGDVIVWSDRSLNNLYLPLEPRGRKAAVKVVRLHNGAVTSVQSFGGKYVVTAGEDGNVRVYDTHFRIVAWFEKDTRGPIVSLSFRTPRNLDGSKASTISQMVDAPEFIVSTKYGRVFLATKAREGANNTLDMVKLLETQSGSIHALSVHPRSTHFAVGGSARIVHVWDYKTKTLVAKRKFEHEELTLESLSYAPHGNCLAVGFQNGVLKVVSSNELKELEYQYTDPSDNTVSTRNATFHASRSPITKLAFSPDGQYLATADGQLRVSLFQFQPPEASAANEWVYIGSFKSHQQAVVGLEFYEEAGKLVLASTGKDRSLVKYDVRGSSVGSGIQFMDHRKLEQLAHPTTVCWIPHPKKALLLSANDEYKFKLVNPTTGNVRRTVLAPLLGGPMVRLQMVPTNAPEYKDKLLVYQTASKQIGLIKLPLDGNPNRSIAWIAHPAEIAGCGVTHDGKQLLTIGKHDYAINLIALDPTPLDAQIAIGGEGNTPFLRMLPDSGQGDFFHQMEDLFYYAQIKSQGEDTAELHEISKTVSVEQVPSLMRALGYYPTEKEVEELMNEIKYDHLAEEGTAVTEITIQDLVRLYVNHRPVQDLTEPDVVEAFQNLMVAPKSATTTTTPASDATLLGKHSTETFLQLLQEYGEVMSDEELLHTLGTLLEDHARPGTSADAMLGEEVSAKELLQHVLGMQEAPIEVATSSVVV